MITMRASRPLVRTRNRQTLPGPSRKGQGGLGHGENARRQQGNKGTGGGEREDGQNQEEKNII